MFTYNHHQHYNLTVASLSQNIGKGNLFTVFQQLTAHARTHTTDCFKKKNEYKKKSKVQKFFVGFSLKKSKLIRVERPKARQFPARVQCVHTSIHYNTCGIARPITKISLATLRHVSNTIKRFGLLEYDFNYSLFTIISLISQREMAQCAAAFLVNAPIKQRHAASTSLRVDELPTRFLPPPRDLNKG